METLKKLHKARTGLILDHPFFGSIALHLTLKEDRSQSTAWTDGKNLGYNPDFINKISPAELKGLIAHEVLHVANQHHLRRQERDPKRWNVAADYAINGILVDAGFSLPAGGLTGKTGSAESIYNQLPAEKQGQGQGQGQGQPGQGQGDWGQVRDMPGSGADGKATSAEIEDATVLGKIMVSQAAAMARACGKLPGSLKRLIDEMLEPEVNWKAELRRFLTQVNRNDYSWQRINQRYACQGIYLPGLYNQEIGHIAVAIDTSGSIDGALLAQFTAELDSIRQENPGQITVIYCDSTVQSAQTFQADDPLEIKPEGGGGTDFKPPFTWLAEQGIDPVCLIYLTDGYCGSFADCPDFPVLWTVYGNKDFRPPYGETLPIK